MGGSFRLRNLWNALTERWRDGDVPRHRTRLPYYDFGFSATFTSIRRGCSSGRLGRNRVSTP